MSEKNRKEIDKTRKKHDEELYDESLNDSFPASDPPSRTHTGDKNKVEKKNPNLK